MTGRLRPDGRTRRRARRSFTHIGALVLAASLPLAFDAAAPEIADAQASINCAAGVPDEWEFLAGASSNKVGQQILCNYSVTGTVNGQRGQLVGGTAITIEYFCSAADASKRFDGVTSSKRKTETARVDGELLVIEEGPSAKNPDNPQSVGITSTFYDGVYNLFEKEWRLLNPQVFATIVVITNRGQTPEDKRLSVKQVEAVARSLANANSSGAGCAIPGAGGGGGGDNTAIVVVGGIGLVAAAALAASKAKKAKTAAADGATAPTEKLDMAILQIDAKEFDVDPANPATVTLTGWNVGDDGVPVHVPMTIWITAAPGCGVQVVPDQADGQLIAVLSVDPTAQSAQSEVELVASGVWKGKQVSETITVRLGGDLELRLY